jgi:hypothetical protein
LISLSTVLRYHKREYDVKSTLISIKKGIKIEKKLVESGIFQRQNASTGGKNFFRP